MKELLTGKRLQTDGVLAEMLKIKPSVIPRFRGLVNKGIDITVVNKRGPKPKVDDIITTKII